ncbi:MAG: DNA polymerase III subunit gamma/tau, partial [Lachnospiraceae bacterium]|nr:DNA polymerase III subunit gamma/tau [Lachnospiraceae bacterium]
GIRSGELSVSVSGGATAGAQAQPKVKKVLDRAVPEDIQKLVKGWPGILARMGNPMKTFMQRARLSLGNNDVLQIVFDNKQYADKYANESAAELQDVLDAAIGKHVEFETRFLEQQQAFEENYVNLQAINFDIVTEDEEKEN